MGSSSKRSIGISFMADMQLNQPPQFEAISAGHYTSGGNDPVMVEVINQDPVTGIVTLEVLSEDSGCRVETISATLFKQLFTLSSLKT